MDSRYRSLWTRGNEIFDGIDHDAALVEMVKKGTLDAILDFPSKSKDEIAAYQLKKLSKLADHAYTNIPLYKKKYSAVGFRPGDIKTFQDFEQLPILYKDEVIRGFPNDIVRNPGDFANQSGELIDPGDYRFSIRSSGSSGQFVTMAVDLNAIYTDTLQGIRQFLRQSDFQYKEQDGMLFIYTCPWWVNNIGGGYNMDYLPTTTDPIVALEHIKRTNPKVLSTYPTYLQKLCELEAKLSEFGVSHAIVHSEQSTKKSRNAMAEQLGIKVYDEFSSEELTRIALECDGDNYHLEEDACYTEVIDPHTKRRIDKGEGLVVGTNLLNTATPFIRYHQGDVVSIDSDAECGCGNNGRIISGIQGREQDFITLPSGMSIPPTAFMDTAYGWFLDRQIPVHGMKYQIVQTTPNSLEVRLSPGKYELAQEDFNKIRESMHQLVGKEMTVNINFDQFTQTSAKHKPVVNAIDRQNY